MTAPERFAEKSNSLMHRGAVHNMTQSRHRLCSNAVLHKPI